MSTIFVTTGATVTFKDLIELTLDAKFISSVQRQGYRKLIIQFGSQPDGVGIFTTKVEQLGSKVSKSNELVSAELQNDFKVEGFPFTPNIKSVMSQANLIISHAGTGSILDSLRLQKPLIVVVNSKLMNNHQMEITDELMKGNLLRGCSANLEELISNVELINKVKLDKLPGPNKIIIDQILNEL